MQDYNIDDFIWYGAEEKKQEKAQWFISIANGASLHFSPALREAISSPIRLGVNIQNGCSDTLLALLPSPEGGLPIPKNGTIKARFVITQLMQRGVHLPARFVVQREKELWIAQPVTGNDSAEAPAMKPAEQLNRREKRNFTSRSREATH